MLSTGGTGPGPRIRLSLVKADKASKFRLQEKYKGLYFVDKDPDGDNNYYGGDGGPVPDGECENRRIMGLIWENRRGWRVETKVCGDLHGPSVNYLINPTLIRMINKESTHNRSVRFTSQI